MPKLKWTFEAVMAEAAKYSTRQSFRKGSPGAYCAASQNGWLREIGLPKDSHVIWTRESLLEVASRFETMSDFRKAHGGAYETARLKGMLGQLALKSKVPDNKGNIPRVPQKWTLEAIKSEASKYSSRRAFQVGSRSAYMSARRYGWLEEIGLPRKEETWTFEAVKAEAEKFMSRGDLASGNRSAYNKARKKGWLDVLFPK